MSINKLKHMIREAVAETVEGILNDPNKRSLLEEGILDWVGSGFSGQKSILQWAKATRTRIVEIVKNKDAVLDSQNRSQLYAMANKIEKAIRESYENGFKMGELNGRTRK